MFLRDSLFNRLVKEFSDTNITRFQVGLGHSYSRSKIKTDPHRQDKPVQNAVALLENVSFFFWFYSISLHLIPK
jgi:RNA processing factor Prp31